MCRNIRYIRGNAGISIFYDTIFCFWGIYSRGWYLAKRNIAICQIKATAAVAAQQQLHLKGCCCRFSRFGISRRACNELSIYELQAALRLTQQLSGTQGIWRLFRSNSIELHSRDLTTEKTRFNDSRWAEDTTDCMRDCLVDNKTDSDYIVRRDWIYKICFRSDIRRQNEFWSAVYVHPLRMLDKDSYVKICY